MEALDETTVRATLEAIAAATDREDAVGVLDHLAPNVQITIDLERGGQRVTFTRATYTTYLRDVFAAIDSYTLDEYTVSDIVIAPDGQRDTASAQMIAMVRLRGGGTSRSSTTQTITIALVDGRPLVTQIAATARTIR